MFNWKMANWPCLALLVIFCCSVAVVQGFSDGKKLTQGTSAARQLYCKRLPGKREPLHFNPLCPGSGYCSPSPDFGLFYTLDVSNTTYWLNLITVTIAAKPDSGKSVTGFSIVALDESGRVAGSFMEDDLNVIVGTCNDVIAITDETHAAFHKMADFERKNLSLQWQPDGYNHGKVKFVIWIVNNHSDVYVMESPVLTSEKDGKSTLNVETSLNTVVSTGDMTKFEDSFFYRSKKGYQLDLENPFSAFSKSPSENEIFERKPAVSGSEGLSEFALAKLAAIRAQNGEGGGNISQSGFESSNSSDVGSENPYNAFYGNDSISSSNSELESQINLQPGLDTTTVYPYFGDSPRNDGPVVTSQSPSYINETTAAIVNDFSKNAWDTNTAPNTAPRPDPYLPEATTLPNIYMDNTLATTPATYEPDISNTTANSNTLRRNEWVSNDVRSDSNGFPNPGSTFNSGMQIPELFNRDNNNLNTPLSGSNSFFSSGSSFPETTTTIPTSNNYPNNNPLSSDPNAAPNPGFTDTNPGSNQGVPGTYPPSIPGAAGTNSVSMFGPPSNNADPMFANITPNLPITTPATNSLPSYDTTASINSAGDNLGLNPISRGSDSSLSPNYVPTDTTTPSNAYIPATPSTTGNIYDNSNVNSFKDGFWNNPGSGGIQWSL